MPTTLIHIFTVAQMNHIVVQDTHGTIFLTTVPVSKYVRDIYIKELNLIFCPRQIIFLLMINTLFIFL